MDIFTSFATDESLEEEGVVVFLSKKDPYGPGDPAVDPWIKVARVGNPAYSKAVLESHQRVEAAKKAEGLTDEQAETRGRNAMTEVMAKTILKGFGNLTFQGAVLPPGFDSHLTFLRVKDFRELVFSHAANVDLYRVAAQKDASGN